MILPVAMTAPPALKTLVKTDHYHVRRQEQGAISMKQTRRYKEGQKRALVTLMLIQWEQRQQRREVSSLDPFSWKRLGKRSP